MEEKPKIVTVTGRPLSGKSLIISKLLERRSDLEMFRGKSFTTRGPRKDDVPGEYEYVSNDEFNRMESEGEFLWAFTHGHYRVGTRRDDVVNALRSDKVSVMTLVPEAVAKLVTFVGEERVIPFFIESTEADSLSRLPSRRDKAQDTLDRYYDTKDWKVLMFRLGIMPLEISNPNESEPGQSSLFTMLAALELKGL